MKNKVLNYLSLVCNATIVGLVAYAIVGFFTVGGQGNMEVIGFSCFRYFTVLSNVLVAITSLVVLFFNVKHVKNGIKNLPHVALLVKFVGTVSVTVTFLTVVFFLGPTLGYLAMFEGVNMILHAIVPIVAIISLTVLEVNKPFTAKQSWLGLIPTVLYSIVYVVMVIFVKGWQDFYGFTFGGKLYLAPVSLVVMYLATMLFSVGLVSLRNLVCKRYAKSNCNLQ